jgi:hypothetical protein
MIHMIQELFGQTLRCVFAASVRFRTDRGRGHTLIDVIVPSEFLFKVLVIVLGLVPVVLLIMAMYLDHR